MLDHLTARLLGKSLEGHPPITTLVRSLHCLTLGMVWIGTDRFAFPLSTVPLRRACLSKCRALLYVETGRHMWRGVFLVVSSQRSVVITWKRIKWIKNGAAVALWILVALRWRSCSTNQPGYHWQRVYQNGNGSIWCCFGSVVKETLK